MTAISFSSTSARLIQAGAFARVIELSGAARVKPEDTERQATGTSARSHGIELLARTWRRYRGNYGLAEIERGVVGWRRTLSRAAERS